MAIIADFISFYIRKSEIKLRFPGGLLKFKKHFRPPLEDEHLVGFTFMSGEYADAVISRINEYGFKFERDNPDTDIGVVTQPFGKYSQCDWLEVEPLEGWTISAVWLKGTNPGKIVCPEYLMHEDNKGSNQQVLENIFKNNQIDIQQGDLFQTPVDPFPTEFDFDRIEGMMLGLAIGDALGVTSEGMIPSSRRERFGEVRDYIPNRYVTEARGFPSDDTQLAFWTLEQMIQDKSFDPDRVASRFCQGRIFGIGATVKGFIRNYKAGLPWYKAGPRSAGNGALMRIAPIVIPHLRSGGTELWVDTALLAMITHNDSASISACLAFIRILREALQMDSFPDPTWWLDTYVKTAKTLEIKNTYRPRGGAFTDYQGPLWLFVDEKVRKAFGQGLSVIEAGKAWYSGAYLLETVPSIIYILMRHGHDLEEAIVRAVNDTKDNDTIAAIVGAAVGALHGKARIPGRWIRDLSGRTTDRDDGRVFELLKEAKNLWWN